jgi:GT2 family glycosyltransferase
MRRDRIMTDESTRGTAGALTKCARLAQEARDRPTGLGGRTSLIICTRNRREELATTLRAISWLETPPDEIVVYDDASTDGTALWLSSECPDIVLIRGVKRRGPAFGRNRGVEASTGEYLLFLDDDAHFIDKDAIPLGIARMEAEPELGILTFALLNHLGCEVPPWYGPARYTEVFITTGCLVRRSAWEDAGGMREFFVIYWEEWDLALRVLNAGWRILFFPEVKTFHRNYHAGRRRSSVLVRYFMNESLTVFLNEPFPHCVFDGIHHTLRPLWFALKEGRLGAFLLSLVVSPTILVRTVRYRNPIPRETQHMVDVLRRGRATDWCDLVAAARAKERCTPEIRLRERLGRFRRKP